MPAETLADLHARARELGVSGYRKLTKDELRDAIERAPGEDPADEEVASTESVDEATQTEERPTRRRRRGGRGGRGRSRAGARQAAGGNGDTPDEGDRAERGRARGESREDEESRESREPEEEVETEEVSGILDRMPQGYGFLRLEGLRASDGDVYISASQIKRCELRAGDEVRGPAREPRRGERHRALVRVDSVNGEPPEGERAVFETLTPVAPSRRMLADDAEAPPLLRAIDLLAPLAFGQRVLVLAEPRSGRTTLLREIGEALAGSEAGVLVLLADERPEEVTAWRQALPDAEILAAPADQEPRDQVRTAELGIGAAKRRAEHGEDVVVLIDSLSRLALGYRDPARVKKIFGAGRDLAEEEAGSLTVIATVLGADEAGASVNEVLETTENSLIRLSADLAAQGITPAVVVAETRTTGEEELRDPDSYERARALRAELAELDPADAATALGERVAAEPTNAGVLGSG